jgi:hypothetical protein
MVYLFTFLSIFTTRGCARLMDEFRIEWLDLLHFFTQRIITINYSAVAVSTLYSSLLYTLMFSVITSRILATDLYQSQCNFKLHMKSSLDILITFLPLLLNYFAKCQLRRLSLLILAARIPHYIVSGRPPQKTQLLLLLLYDSLLQRCVYDTVA